MLESFRIDEKGLIYKEKSEEPIKDIESATSFLKSLRLNEKHILKAAWEGKEVLVETYSFAFVIDSIEGLQGEFLQAQAQYGFKLNLDLNKVFLDHQDRFIIYNPYGLACILSDKAQEDLFSMTDSFSDEDIKIKGQTYLTPAWLQKNNDISKSQNWSNRYEQNNLGWDIGEPSPSLVWIVDKLKLPKMRVAVLGSGIGHDAHFLATRGHKVTGFDFSPQAIEQAKKTYPETENLRWICKDVFDLPESYRGQFDLVIEHTCFCAVDPDRRDELVRVWKEILSEEGQVLGVFYVMQKNLGPPYGATEQEIFERIKSFFRVNMWVRSKASIPRRLGRELIALIRKERSS